jgi:hypothetical protein
MALPLISHLAARLRARMHVQVELTLIPSDFQTPAAVPVGGNVVRIFRGPSTLTVGRHVQFSVYVARHLDDIWPGPSFVPYDRFCAARLMEVFLNGSLPVCQVALDEHLILDAPTTTPQLRASRLEYVVELVKWKLR